MRRGFLMLLFWLPFGVYLAGFWPGVMTFDSLSQWAQATGRLPWTDVHPALSTAGFWVASELGSPAILAGAQSFFLTWAIVSFASAVGDLGAPLWAVLSACGAVLLAPSVGLFSVSLWKDVPYTAAILMLGAQVLRMMGAQLLLAGDDTVGGRNTLLDYLLVRAVLWAALASLLRQNGLVVVLVVLAAVAVGFRHLRVRAGVALIALPLAFLMVRFFVLPGMGVTPAKSSVLQETLAHEVAAYVRHTPEQLTDDDWRVIDAIGQRTTWATAYDCRSADSLYQAPGFRPGAIDQFPDVLPALWRSLVLGNPATALRHRICTTELAWHPFGAGETWFFTAGRAIERNNLGLRSAPLDDRLDKALNKAVSITELRGLRPFFWRAPIWIALAFGILIAQAVRRRRWLWLVPAAPILGQQLSILVANPAQDAHYMAAAGIAAVLLLPLAFREPFELSVRSTDAKATAEEPRRRPWRPGTPPVEQAWPSSDGSP